MNVLLMNGSPAQQSHVGVLLEYLSGLLVEKGAQAEIVSLLMLNLPVNNPLFHDDASKSDNATVRKFAAQVAEADMVVLGTPLYHGSFSGLLKSALDNLDADAFSGKKVLIVSNSSGVRNAQQAAHQLVVVARTMYGQVYNRLIGTAGADYTHANGVLALTNQEILARCQSIVDALI